MKKRLEEVGSLPITKFSWEHFFNVKKCWLSFPIFISFRKFTWSSGISSTLPWLVVLKWLRYDSDHLICSSHEIVLFSWNIFISMESVLEYSPKNMSPSREFDSRKLNCSRRAKGLDGGGLNGNHTMRAPPIPSIYPPFRRTLSNPILTTPFTTTSTISLVRPLMPIQLFRF